MGLSITSGGEKRSYTDSKPSSDDEKRLTLHSNTRTIWSTHKRNASEDELLWR